MKEKTACLKRWSKENKWFLIGIALVTVYVFSNYLYGYKLSFTNINYRTQPFNVYGVETVGPDFSDVADSEYPLIYKMLYSKTGFSMWDSDLALGTESNTIAELMNPMKWIYVFPMEIAVFLKAFFEFLIAFLSMYLFLKVIGLKKYSAALGSILYTFSSVIVAWLGWAHSDVAVWAPLLFFAVEKLLSTIKVKYMFLSAFVIYMMLIVGMPTYAAYFLYAAGIYIVIFTCIKHWKNKRNIFIVGGLFAMSVLIAAVLSFPYTSTLLTSVVSNEYAASRSYQAEAVLPLDYLRTFIFPTIRDGLSIHRNESTIYVGVTSVALFPFAFCNIKKKKENRNFFFLWMSVIVFLLVFTGLLNFVYTKLPLVNTSNKFRVLTLLTFSLAVLAGISINDILENRDYYKKRLFLLVGLALWTSAVICVASSNGIYDIYAGNINKIIFVVAGIIICLMVLIYKNYKPIYCILAILIVVDSCQFVKEYLPWIDAKTEMIPAPSPSVEYMMENTADGERIAGIGDWTLFPNTPSYYELNDIRVHGFVATNADLVEYYTNIDEEAYLTPTRITLNHIKNYELLKYMGVKYIYGSDFVEVTRLDDSQSEQEPLGPIASHSSVSQDVSLKKGVNLIQLMMATYKSETKSDGNIHFQLISKKTGEIVYETSIPVKAIRDGMYMNITMGEDVVEKDGIYTMLIAFDDLEGDTIAFWTTDSDSSTLTYEKDTFPCSIVMNVAYRNEDYEIVYSPSDAMLIAQLSEYSDKAELIESASILPTESDILSVMMQDYSEHTVFISEENEAFEYHLPLTDNETLEVEEYDDDYVRLRCTSEYDRYVVLNDYYDENWSAYVNGEKIEILKVNYLMRGIKVAPGNDMIIEFKYEPTKLYAVTFFSATVFLLVLILFFFRNKVQKGLDKIINNLI